MKTTNIEGFVRELRGRTDGAEWNRFLTRQIVTARIKMVPQQPLPDGRGSEKPTTVNEFNDRRISRGGFSTRL